MVPRSTQRVRCGESATSAQDGDSAARRRTGDTVAKHGQGYPTRTVRALHLGSYYGYAEWDLLGLQSAWLAWSLAALFVAMFVASLTLFVLARSAIS